MCIRDRYLSDVDGPEEIENSEEMIFAAQLNEERLNNRFENIKADLNSEINNGLLEVEREGDEVVIRIASQGSFNSGSAIVAQSFTATLDRVGETINQESGNVRIEGHTDNIPITKRLAKQWYNQTNLRLSSARALSVVEFWSSNSCNQYNLPLELKQEWFTTVGIGEFSPIADNQIL